MLFRKEIRKNFRINFCTKKKRTLKCTQVCTRTMRKEFGSPKRKNDTPLTTNRKFGRASLNASLTVEAALVLPVFLYMTAGVISLTGLMGRAGALEGSIQDTAKQMAVYAYAVKNNSGKKGSLQGGISAAYAYSRLRKHGKSLKSFHLGYSSFLDNSERIDLVAAYRVSRGVPVFSFGNPQILQRGCVRAWTGRDFREAAGSGGKKGKGQVYVTENREVYHKSLNCTHLRLSIRQIQADLASGLRNRYGAKYYACSCCKSGTGQTVYITDTGNRYHASLSCSGLKRTIRCVPASEAEDLPPCSKCGG